MIYPNMPFRQLTLCLLWILVTVASCTKPGLGGRNDYYVTPQHHSRNIPGCTLYIKYGTQEFPGADASAYDVQYPAANADSVRLLVSGLKKGDYYFYCVGYDTLIAAPVTGGIPVKIRSTSGTTYLAVPITE